MLANNVLTALQYRGHGMSMTLAVTGYIYISPDLSQRRLSRYCIKQRCSYSSLKSSYCRHICRLEQRNLIFFQAIFLPTPLRTAHNTDVCKQVKGVKDWHVELGFCISNFCSSILEEPRATINFFYTFHSVHCSPVTIT